MSWTWPDSVITRVIDGDTIEARVSRDMGFGGRAEFIVRLRLNRINAPAIKYDLGRRAQAWLTILLRDAIVTIETLKPYKYGGPDDSPGEWMCEVTTAKGQNVSDLMVQAGYAVYWDGEGTRPGDDGAS